MIDEEVQDRQEIKQGRRPDISDEEVFDACDAIRAAGTSPAKITGYAVRKFFKDAEKPNGRGDPRRYDRVIAQWRSDRRYDEPAARPRPSSAAEDVVSKVEAAVTAAVTALQAIPAALREGIGRIDVDAKAAIDTVRKEEAAARDRLVEEFHARDEEAADAVVENDNLVEGLREQIAVLKEAHAADIARMSGEIATRDQMIAGLIEQIEGVDGAPGLRARAEQATEHERTIERLRGEADQARKDKESAESERDQARRDAQEYEHRSTAAEVAYRSLDERLTALTDQVARLTHTAPPTGDAAVKAPRRGADQPETH